MLRFASYTVPKILCLLCTGLIHLTEFVMTLRFLICARHHEWVPYQNHQKPYYLIKLRNSRVGVIKFGIFFFLSLTLPRLHKKKVKKEKLVIIMTLWNTKPHYSVGLIETNKTLKIKYLPSKSVIMASCLFLSFCKLLDFSSSSDKLVVNSEILSSNSFFS